MTGGGSNMTDEKTKQRALRSEEERALLIRALLEAREEKITAALDAAPSFPPSRRHRRAMKRILSMTAEKMGRAEENTLRKKPSLPVYRGKGRRKKLGILFAVLIALLLVLSLGLYVAATRCGSFGDLLFILQKLGPGEYYDDGVYSVFTAESYENYAAPDEWLRAGREEAIYPASLPKGLEVKKILAFDLQGDREIHFCFNDTRYVFMILEGSGNLTAENLLRFEYNGIPFYLFEKSKSGAWQAFWLYDDFFYILCAPTQEELFRMIEGLCYPFDV